MKNVGTCADVIVPTGVITQGNYVVTYHPGALTVVENPVIVSHWICDHVDAGSNYVHLAIDPTLSVAKTTESLQAFIIANAGNFYAVYATQQANLNKTAGVSVPIAYRVNPTGNAGEQDIARGWIWFTVPVPDNVNAHGLLWRISWKKAEE